MKRATIGISLTTAVFAGTIANKDVDENSNITERGGI